MTDTGSGATESIVQLQREQWIVTCTQDPTITHHAGWLPDVLAAHRQAVRFHLHRDVEFRYALGNEATAELIARIRTAGAHVAALRRQAAHAEAAIRTDRLGLVRELAALHVAPREIAHILGIPVTAIPRELGTDRDARLARFLLAQPGDATDPGAVNRLF